MNNWIFVIGLVVGLILGSFIPGKKEIITERKVDTLKTTITHIDTLPKIIVTERLERVWVNVDSLYQAAKDSALKLLKNDSTALHYARYESVTDTTISDSLSNIYVKASYYSRLPLDPKRSMEIEIEKELFIPTIYYKEDLPFYQEKCFIPLMALGVVTGVLIWTK